MFEDNQYNDNTFWNLLDGNLSEQEECELIKACSENKVLAEKLEEIKRAHVRLKSLIEQTSEHSPQMTPNIMAKIHKLEQGNAQYADKSDPIVRAIFLLLSIGLSIPVYYCFTRIKPLDNLSILMSDDVLITVIPILIVFFTAICISFVMKLNLLKQKLTY